MNTNQEPVISLQLPLSQVNVALAGLGELPFKVAAPLVESIQRQAHAQLQGSPSGEVAPAAETA